MPRHNEPAERTSSRRLFDQGDGWRLRASTAGLISHVLPIVVLAVGITAWLSMFAPASGQQRAFPAQRLQTSNPNPAYRQPNSYPRQTLGTPQYSSQPSVRTAALPTAQATNSIPEFEAAPTPDDADQGVASDQVAWQMPAFVRKIAEGGWLMLPLGVCSLIVLALSFERMISLRRSRVIPRPFVRRFTECVEDGQLSFDEATELCEEFNCPVAEVFQAAVRRWGRPMFEVEQAVMDAGDRVADRLKRFLRVFHAISNVAPLIGLLGTVIGMISAFETLASPDAGQQDLLASGISTALMTTAGGLSVAIPAYLAYMYFSSKSDAYLNEIDKLCQRVVDCISAEGLEETSSSVKSRKRRAA